MTQLYLQLLGVGLLWVTFHCAGMCGPIVAGLVAHDTPVPRAASRREQLLSRTRGVLAYQSGRALTYALLGALAGGLGALFADRLRVVSAIAPLLGALLIALIALYKLLPMHRLQRRADSTWARLGRTLGGWMRRLTRIAPQRGPWRMMLFGALMGLLPCMLMFWVLSLAIASSSMVHGALLMVLLVAMTTPVLVMAGCSASLLPASWRARGERWVPVTLLLTAAWTGLIGAAANGWITHVHLPFHLFGEMYTFMLW